MFVKPQNIGKKRFCRLSRVTANIDGCTSPCKKKLLHHNWAFSNSRFLFIMQIIGITPGTNKKLKNPISVSELDGY
jgi:hypothetical protein